MENREAIRKIKFMRDAYQKLIDENVDEGRLVGTDVTGTWKADTPLNEVYREHVEALDLAISALEKQEQDKWISCKERLPENKKKVLVSYDTEEGKKVDVSMFDKYECLLGLVSAWRPLPEPYTEEEE